jgi:hypothetical protein
MIFSETIHLLEQKYGQKSRLYFHGDPNPEDLNNFQVGNYSKCFWVTNSLYYAIRYARFGFPEKQKTLANGRIYVFHAKKELNIFNAQSKKDIRQLERAFGFSIGSKTLKQLQTMDWELNTVLDRDDIIFEIKNIGVYDGIFNWEHRTEDNNRPSIGLFDPNILVKKDSFLYSELKKSEELKKYIHDENERAIQRIARNTQRLNRPIREGIYFEFEENPNWLILKEEADKIDYNKFEKIYLKSKRLKK